jgi:hypothetical protein
MPVRKNLAKACRSHALSSSGSDPWQALFEAGEEMRISGQSDLIPY